MNADLQIEYPLLAGTILFGLFVSFIIYFVLLYRRAQDAMVVEQERMRHVLLRAEVEIREQTLIQVSRELHDNLGQLTSLININLKMLGIQQNEQDKLRISEIKALVLQLSHDIRSLSTSLNGTQISNLGLANLLQREIERLLRLELIDVSFSIDNTLLEQLPPDKSIIIFRVIQELFNNTLKHSQATLATLVIEARKKGIHFQYTDNGKGFNTQSAEIKGNGLQNMMQRCQLVGFTYTLQSAAGQGVLVDIYIDL